MEERALPGIGRQRVRFTIDTRESEGFDLLAESCPYGVVWLHGRCDSYAALSPAELLQTLDAYLADTWPEAEE